MAFNIGKIFSKINLNGVFRDLGRTDVFKNVKIDDVFRTVGTVTRLRDISFGDIIRVVPEVIGGIKINPDDELGRVISGLDNIDLQDFTVDGFVKNLGDILPVKNLKMDRLFSNVDDDFLPVFGKLSIDQLVEEVTGLDALNSSGGKIDLLDGIGAALNIVGANNVLSVIKVADFVRGTIGDNNLKGTVKDDLMTGLEGIDKLLGGFGDDIINGGTGNDKMDGGKGDDLLFGGFGNDELKGGRGRDSFAIAFRKGSDLISDFKDKTDKLALVDGLDLNDIRIGQRGRNTVISVGNEEVAVLKGVKSNLITAADFIINQSGF
jgi:Ca2+-binding RTX toxin-like protein